MMRRLQTGSILLEVVLAAGLVIFTLTALAGLSLSVNQGSGRALSEQEALWRLTEGVEAMKTVAFDDVPIVDPGILAWSGTSWVVAAGGPEVLPEGISRTVKVKEVQRDANCVVVQTGTVDPDSKDVETEVSWVDSSGRTQTRTHTTIRTRYLAPLGTCFLANQAANVVIDVDEAEWFGGKQLREVDIINNGGSNVVIDKMMLTWTNARLVEQAFIESVKVWSSTGPGTPLGSQLTGTELNIADYTLAPSANDELNKVQFSGQMSGTIVTITLTFGDGSTLTSDPFIPD